jgi:DUF218 domain
MRSRFLVAGLLLLILALFSAASFLIFQRMYREPMNLWSGPWPQADCGIVLTGAPGRVRDAFDYLARGKIRKLVVSGVYKEAELHELFPYLPFYPEVKTEAIFLEKRSQTTFGNAQQSLVFIEALGCNDVVLMTSQVHMARSYDIFRATFPRQIVIKKLALPNARFERTIWGLGLETFKSIFYLSFRLV